MQSPFEASPLSPGAIIGHTWRLYRRHWRTWLGLTLLTYIPVLLSQQIVSLAFQQVFPGGPVRATAPLGQSTLLWGGLAIIVMFFGALVLGGAAAIFVSDSLRGERPSIFYALDVLFSQRLRRAFLASLFILMVAVITSPPVLLAVLPLNTITALATALPWIASLGLAIALVALVATRHLDSLPLLLAVGLLVGYSVFAMQSMSQTSDVRAVLAQVNQGLQLFLTALFLLFLPAAVIDPSPLRQALRRGWTIVKQNLPLIFITLFLLWLASDLVGLLAQAAAYLLPQALTSGQWIDLGPWQVTSGYVNFLLYYVPLNLLFVVTIFTPLQAIFAAVVTLDGYWQFEEEAGEDDEEDEEAPQTDDEETGVSIDALESPAEESSLPTEEPPPADVEDDGAEEVDGEDEAIDETPPGELQPLMTYVDLIAFVILVAAGTILSYGSSLLREAVVGWLNQLIG